tara:strand:+ start:251 stop:505 length:255 start_codon:yes stop_codon:yes gene_type:complete
MSIDFRGIDLSKYEKLIRIGTLTEEYEFAQDELHAILIRQRSKLYRESCDTEREIFVLLDRIARELSRRRVASDERAEFMRRLP